jgi:hypothetical protein
MVDSQPDAAVGTLPTPTTGIQWPSAILEQYPALATMSWGNNDNYESGDVDGYDRDASGVEK